MSFNRTHRILTEGLLGTTDATLESFHGLENILSYFLMRSTSVLCHLGTLRNGLEEQTHLCLFV